MLQTGAKLDRQDSSYTSSLVEALMMGSNLHAILDRV